MESAPKEFLIASEGPRWSGEIGEIIGEKWGKWRGEWGITLFDITVKGVV
jgi:hypothetical protein